MSLYVIDTGVVIHMQRYLPRDVFPGPWDRFEALVDEGRCTTTSIVIPELARGWDDCDTWAKSLPGFVIESAEAEIELVAKITSAHPDWVNEQKNAADPWLVARAHCHDAILVTQEGPPKPPGTPDRGLRITNIADEHEVPCIRFEDLARAEGWRFG